MKHTFKSHDLTLPSWGPYTKKYSGISHIPAANDGVRFDLAVFPGFYRRAIQIPNVRFESGFHIWDSAADLSCYTLRHELEWKDQVYADVSFAPLGENARLIHTELHNKTDFPQNLVLHYAAAAFDPNPAFSDFDATGPSVSLPEGAVLCYANNFDDLVFTHPGVRNNLSWDGMRRDELPVKGFLRGYGIGMRFGIGKNGKGDTVSYTFALKQRLHTPVLCVRYLNDCAEDAKYTLSCGTVLSLPPCKTPQLITAALPESIDAGDFSLTLTACGCGNAKLDCFVLCEAAHAQEVSLGVRESGRTPEIFRYEDEHFLVLRYPHIRECYGVIWDAPATQIREIENDELDIFMRDTVHNHVSSTLKGNGKGHYTDVFMRPIPMHAHESLTLSGAVLCADTPENAAARCRELLAAKDCWNDAWAAAKAKMQPPAILPDGKKYEFGQKLERATLCTNVVYPVYMQNQYIRHNTPGRWWDCLYTWDSGFIGLGLAPISLRRSFDCLNTYLTLPDNDEAAFIHHGSMVPVQFYLFADLLNRTQSRELAEYCLPGLMHYYRFYTGKAAGSAMNSKKSGLLSPWDYFYNSGGWDDYPPQVKVHAEKLESVCCPPVNTTHAVRCAKILAYTAQLLGKEELAREFISDAEYFSDALQKYSWNEESGFFSYTMHDENGDAVGPLCVENGIDANMGLGGTSPLYAGVCTEKQADLIWERLFSDRFWTSCGLSTVDRTAPYYRADGYWNGAVWMPHQWFYFKSALDYARADEAFCIADCALSLWQDECAVSYSCFEHFMIESRRGAGWHQFGGLSAPVVQWFSDYYVPGTFTTGFDTYIRSAETADDFSSAELTLDCTTAGKRTVLAVLMPRKMRVSCSAESVCVNSRWDGQWEVTFRVDAPCSVSLTFTPEN